MAGRGNAETERNGAARRRTGHPGPAGAIRSSREGGREEDIARRLAAFLPFVAGRPWDMARRDIIRALREARSAARSGSAHYDPARHAALKRLLARGPCEGPLKP